ncbi:MAG TPA: heparan-alpha-glucosaminide N-acetyltransferase domain-containing protein, partial [Gemmatimonadales bacterium]|nr:heparan-alpha-glucosaminide N-acetyltransferase domain-containing protein [Gemmatimonadales bacterium]
DHTRDFFGVIGADPTNLATTTPALFLTRWVTHLSAPTFFLLTGTGAWLRRGRRGEGGLSRYLLTRGLWLVLLEVTVLRFAMQFNVDYRVTLLTVLWALGWAMIVLAGLVRLPTWAIAAVGGLLITLHNAFDGVQAAALGAWAPLWTILHAPGFLLNAPEHTVFLAYPLVPWIGVTAVGYALGQVYSWPAERRRALLWRTGTALTLGFVLLRLINGYGDPRPWSHQATSGYTLLSFLNTTKYPPSLLFLLMVLGPGLLILAALDGGTPRWLRPILTFGRVPLFYFLGHFLLIHLLAVAWAAARFGTVAGMFQSPSLDRFPITAPEGWGLAPPQVWLVWLVVVALMYPLCRWYERIKATHTWWWLSYL